MAFRPEAVRLVAPDAPEAAMRARIVLVEPLGARDVIHLKVGDHDVRLTSAPGARPHVGDNVGLVVDESRVHLFDDESGQAVR
jgi:multiple sugar transport system ATP-binding protein